MIMFQTAGTGYAPAFGLTTRLGALTPATTYRSDAYIHRLNRALQAEMRAVAAYRSLRQGRPRPAFDHHGESHRLAAKELVRLVVANRGLPEDRSVLSLGLTRTFIQVCEALPSRLTERAATGTLRQLEQQLVTSYRRLLDVAPARDVPTLTRLLRSTLTQAGEAPAES